MENSQQIFANLNTRLKKRLLPEPTNREPIECDSFSDKYDDVINYSLKEHGYEYNLPLDNCYIKRTRRKI